MKAPFKLPIRSEAVGKVQDGTFVLNAADAELICECHAATKSEIAFIVAAVNAYEAKK